MGVVGRTPREEVIEQSCIKLEWRCGSRQFRETRGRRSMANSFAVQTVWGVAVGRKSHQ